VSRRDPVFYVYVLASKPCGMLYLGVTSDLPRRVWEDKIKAVPGFTAKYGVDQLVWFEAHEQAEPARLRERQIMEWKRDWKINLIERENPRWIDPLHKSVVPAEAGTHGRHGYRPSPV